MTELLIVLGIVIFLNVVTFALLLLVLLLRQQPRSASQMSRPSVAPGWRQLQVISDQSSPWRLTPVVVRLPYHQLDRR